VIQNVTVFVVRVWVGKYREELMLNVNVLVLEPGEWDIERN